LGGGKRFQVGGGTVIPTGSSIADYGLNPMRNSGIPGIQNNQSTEFGQGRRGIPQFSNRTTDFGFPYTQFAPANVTPQKRGQLLQPKAVITNF